MAWRTVAATLSGVSWWRRGLRASDLEAFERAWPAVAARVPQWHVLTGDERERLHALARRFVSRTRFEAARGFLLRPEHCATVAAHASLLLLGLPDDDFVDARTVILHRSTVVLHGRRPAGGGLEANGPFPILGQAHYRGPVLLSWSAVVAGTRPGAGSNVVLHEFAHQLDMIDGTVDGTPPLDDPEARARWIEVCTAAYDVVRARRDESVLRPYAGTNPGEFFAVATEVYFTRPVELRAQEPALYAELDGYYGLDLAARAGGTAVA